MAGSVNPVYVSFPQKSKSLRTASDQPVLNPCPPPRSGQGTMISSPPRLMAMASRKFSRTERRVLAGQSHNLSRQESIKCPTATLRKERWKLTFYFQSPLQAQIEKVIRDLKGLVFSESLPLHQNHARFHLKIGCFIFTFPELFLTYFTHSAVYVMTLRTVLFT